MLTINPEDTRKLIRSVHSNYNLDLSELSFNLLRYRISQYLDIHLIKDADTLINRLLEDDTNVDEFLSGISAGSSELFRDPGMWKNLRIHIVPQLFSRFKEPVFWLPKSVSGHDAFSLLILLTEEGFYNQCQIYSSTPNFISLRNLQAGNLEKKFMSLNMENYLNTGGKKSLEDFFDRSKNQIKPSLIRKIKFTRHYNMLHNAPNQVKFIMVRNQLLNYTRPAKIEIINHLAEMLPSGGILVFGIKELFEDTMIARKFESFEAKEGIYKKKEQLT